MIKHDAQTVIVTQEEDMVDILGSSLETLYDKEYTTIAHSSANAIFHYTAPDESVLALRTPDTVAANWALHASSIWVGAVFLADHLSWIGLDTYERPVRVLELGAGAGLPSILCAKTYEEIHVVVSDYPDKLLIQTLEENVKNTGVNEKCRAVGYAWGTDAQDLLKTANNQALDGFDVILAADTLWNSETHGLLADSFKKTLRRTEQARIHLVAGLHTGRWALQRFLDIALDKGFVLRDIHEHEVNREARTRVWDPERAEDDSERRRWVVWISLAWSDA
jgi:EEF1A N-terminal glycine/lysine methyltransferase